MKSSALIATILGSLLAACAHSPLEADYGLSLIHI